jgi:alcohol dehydrogenase
VSEQRPDGGWVCRPRGPLRHYAGLLGPAGATAAGVVAKDKSAERLARIRAALAARSHPRQRGLVAAPGGRLAWRQVPAPLAPPPHGATVHPIAMATCDMDRPIMLGRTPFPLPLHLGHECVAEVLSVGGEVTSFHAGQRVVVPFQINCGTCRSCRAGRTGSCTGVPAVSMYGFGVAGGLWGGAIADALAVPFADEMLVALPEGVDPVAAASVGDNLVDAYRHIAPHLPRLLDEDPHVRVLIVASLKDREAFTASMAIYTGMIALALGAAEVQFADARSDVRELAAKLGMQALAPDDLDDLEPAPLVVDVTARPRGLVTCIGLTAPDGICTSAGGLHAHVRLPLLSAYIRNVTLHIGRSHARALMPDVLALIAGGRLEPRHVVTSVARLDDAPAALREHCQPGAVKTILVAG